MYGRNYRFNARFSSRLWAAQVFCEVGTELCAIYCVAPRFHFEAEVIEDSLAEWVYKSVICILDTIRLQESQVGPGELVAFPDALPRAANAGLFDPLNILPAHPLPAPVADTGAADETNGRLHRLRQRSQAAVRRFEATAEQYRIIRERDFAWPAAGGGKG